MHHAGFRWGAALAASAAVLLSIATAGTTPDLAGRWAMLQVYPRIANLPLVGDSAQTSYVVQFVDIEQDGFSLRMEDRYCFTVIEENSFLAKTEIPDAFMRSLRPQPRSAALREQDGKVTFEQPSYVEVRGAELENPETDALPLGPDDPRVVDQDADGFPGMTVNVSLLGLLQAQIYVAQRVQYRLQGVVLSADRVEGLVEWADEQVVLAATSSLLLAGAESRQDPDPAKHVFVMLRAGDDWTCDWLRDHWREVFGIDEGA